MKICLLSARFPPQRCGVGDYTCFLAGALAGIGHDVDVLTATGNLDEVLYPLPASVRVHRVIDSWATRALPRIIRCLRTLDPQVLLIQYTPHAFDRRGITLAVNLLPALARTTLDIRVVTNFHELYIPFDRVLKRNVTALWQRVTAVLLASASNAVCVTASAWERRLRRLGVRHRIRRIPVGSNIPHATISSDDRERLRTQLLGSLGGMLVAGFGASHDRDIPAALYGVQRLMTRVPARLIWIGAGIPNEQRGVGINWSARLTGLEQGAITWTGELPHPEVSRVLGACDLMVLPFVDGISTRRTSAVTAFQHGLPVLTTRGTEPEPWFVHGANTYLVPTGDAQALADGLLELGTRPDLRARLARGARALHDARFSWEVIARDVGPVLQGQLDD